MNDSPAAILFDELGNPVGVQFDGYVYRLQTQSTLTDAVNGPVAVTPPNTPALPADPALVVAISPNNSFTVNFPKPSTATKTNVAASLTNVVLLPANMNRLGASVYNDSSSGLLYINLGSSADATDFVIKLLPLGYYELPFGYTGQINGAWSVTGGTARITEFTP